MTAEDQPQPQQQTQHPLQRQLLFWLGALVVLVVFLLVFSSILLPFVAGMALAYLLDPLADWFERRGFSRLAATLVILLVFLIFFIAVLLLLIPVLVDQTTQFINRLPSLITDLQTMLQPLFDTDLARYLGIDGAALPDQIAGFVGNGTDWLAGLLNSLWSGGRAIVAVLSLLVITPVVAFYLLYDWDRMLSGVDALLPRQHAATIRDLGRQMSRAIAGFVRGQSLVVLILGVFYATALAIIGLHFGLIIGLIAGLLSFIPFVGTATGFIVSVGVATAQWGPGGTGSGSSSRLLFSLRAKCLKATICSRRSSAIRSAFTRCG